MRSHDRIRLMALVLILALGAVATPAQQQAPSTPTRPANVPEVPARGPLAVSDTARAEILAEIKAPAGFQVKVFAAPPIVNYPTCVTAAHTGEIFVCVDRNGSLQADPGMGHILRLVDKDQDGQADEYTLFATLD